jgi:biotin-dependent carboxylase-like uncharacterized protein
MTAALEVISPGLSTTVQDVGRFGLQRLGVPVSGALDLIALAAANVVVGNAAAMAGLEMLYQGVVLSVAADSVRLAVAGGGARLEIDAGEGGRRVGALESVTLKRGDRVKVVIAGPGIVAYLAVEGGLSLEPHLGSRSTYLRARLGGIEGRALAAGDRVPLAREAASARAEQRLPGVGLPVGERVRVVLGPQDDHFRPEAIEILTSSPYRVSPSSDRMGLRLVGAELPHISDYNIVSDGIAPGAIQVPGDRLPIVLLSDRQTTGGYTKIATVISADLPLLGRVGPGATVRFEQVSLVAATAIRRALEAEILSWHGRLLPAGMAGAVDADLLLAENLVSGVIDGEAGP